jgi:hypothetical protein
MIEKFCELLAHMSTHSKPLTEKLMNVALEGLRK